MATSPQGAVPEGAGKAQRRREIANFYFEPPLRSPAPSGAAQIQQNKGDRAPGYCLERGIWQQC
ncbi:MAG: hypothetical protein ACREYC_04325 [Gammaproteobacteria bacterium]